MSDETREWTDCRGRNWTVKLSRERYGTGGERTRTLAFERPEDERLWIPLLDEGALSDLGDDELSHHLSNAERLK